MHLGSAWRGTAAILACLAFGRSLAGCGSDAGAAATTPSGDAGDSGTDPNTQPNSGDDGGDRGDGSTTQPGLNAISTENLLPGSDDWLLGSPATHREIEGYASVTSVAPGEKISFYVSTASPKYTVDVYRLGWYAGKGGRRVADQVERTGTAQVMPTPEADGFIECDWTDPHEITIPAAWVSGYYLVKLTTSDTKKQAYIPFIVRDDAKVSTYLVQSSVTTMQAYNNWGNKSLYDYNSDGEVRASRVSFHRPYALGLNPESAAGIGAGEIITNFQGAPQSPPMGWELPMLRFLEREGYDVSYVTSVDVHRDANLVAKHPVFLSVGHDEYWSYQMRDHVEYARDHGATSLAFFSGNESYWQIRFQNGKHGEPNSTIYCTKDAASDPASAGADSHLTTVLFGDQLVSRSEEGIGGVSFEDYGINTDLIVDHPTSWVFAGTNLAQGAAIPGLLGYEVDGIKEIPLPGVRRITHSPWTTALPSSGMADATTRQLPSGAETFSIGSIQFSLGLDDYRPAGVTQPNVKNDAAIQMTKNVLARFATPRPHRNLSPLLLDEPFNTTLDVDRWVKRTVSEGAAAFDPAVPVAVTAGRLTVTPRASTAGLKHGGVVTARTFPMMCGSAQVELVQSAVGASTDTSFAVTVDSGHWYRFTVEDGGLYFGANDDAVSQTSVTYNASQHRFLRIRHDCVGDKILFETSTNGSSWTTQRSVARTVDLRSAFLELEAGTFQSESAPGQAVFDNLHVTVTGVRDFFEGQRDPEVFTPEALHEGHFNPEVPIFPGGGHLHLRPLAGVGGQNHIGFATTRELDWTGGSAGITVLQPPNPDTEASVSFAVVSQAPGWARFAISAGKLFMQDELQGQTNGDSIPHDPTAHKFLRIRHESGTDQIVWETSADGSAWVERRRVARPFPVSALRAEIEGGTYRSEAAGGEVIVDDFFFAR
jgi:hypothetical protein